MYDLQTITFLEDSAGPFLAGDNPLIQLDGYSVGFHAQLYEQRCQRERNRAVAILTVDLYFHLRRHLISEAWAARDAERLRILRNSPTVGEDSVELPPGFWGTMGAFRMSGDHDITRLLSELSHGDPHAASKLIPVVYDELRHLAAGYMRRERPDHTLQPTALVHEAYVKLLAQRSVDWQGRAHFFGVAAQLMRRILIDHARGHLRQKRGGEQRKVSLDEALVFSEQQSAEILAVDESLQRLEQVDPRQARVVELRFFGGLNIEETAEVLKVSAKTVKRDWSVAQAWLYADIKKCHGTDLGTVGAG
jgi:RNA polymerase sigma-70 factor, ECF subfamily